MNFLTRLRNMFNVHNDRIQTTDNAVRLESLVQVVDDFGKALHYGFMLAGIIMVTLFIIILWLSYKTLMYMPGVLIFLSAVVVGYVIQSRLGRAQEQREEFDFSAEKAEKSSLPDDIPRSRGMEKAYKLYSNVIGDEIWH